MDDYTKSDTRTSSTNQERLQELITLGLEKTARVSKTQSSSAPYIRSINAIKDSVGSAVKNSKEAALAWSAVCILLEFLVNATTESAANRKGLEYVVERLEYNNSLAGKRLLEQHDTPAIKNQMRLRLINLYKKILIYLIKSVCYHNRSRLGAVLRDAVKLDDWEDLLQDVKEAEAGLDRDASTLNAYNNTAIMDQILKLTEQSASLQLTAEDNECLRQLRVTDPRDDKKRIELTKGGLLQDSYAWILENEAYKTWRTNRKSLWIHGDPGKGKTMLLAGIIDRWLADQKTESLPPIAYFFCQASDPRINSAINVLRGLLYMMICEDPNLIIHVWQRYYESGSALFTDANAWVVLTKIFAAVLKDKLAYIIIDALDECTHGRELLLDLIANNSNVVWLVSSRNWPEISERLSEAMPGVSLELNARAVSSAVERYIDIKATKLAKDKHLTPQDLATIKNYLRSRAEGTFLWVSLVCFNLQRTIKPLLLSRLKSFPPGLNSAYLYMLHQLDTEESSYHLSILGIVLCAYRPLTLNELSAIGLPADATDDQELLLTSIIRESGFLTTQNSNNGITVVFVHLSAKEFLIDHSEAKSRLNMFSFHLLLYKRSLDLVNTSLKRNIYGLENVFIDINDVQRPSPDPLRFVSYSCSFWLEHLMESYRDRDDVASLWKSDEDSIHRLLKSNLLYWIESLSLLRDLPRGVLGLLHLRNKTKHLVHDEKLGNSDVLDLLVSSSKFVLACNDLVTNLPLQLPVSSLPILSYDHPLRQIYFHNIPSWLIVSSKTRSLPDNVATSKMEWFYSPEALTTTCDGNLIAMGSYPSISIHSGLTGATLLYFNVKDYSIPDDSSVLEDDIALGGSWESRDYSEFRIGFKKGLHFTPDGKCIVENGQQQVIVQYWSAEDGRRQRMVDLRSVIPTLEVEMKENRKHLDKLCLIVKNSCIACALSNYIHLFDKDWALLKRFEFEAAVAEFAVSLDEKLLAVACQSAKSSLCVKNIASQATLWTLNFGMPGVDPWIEKILFSAAGQLFALFHRSGIRTYHGLSGLQTDKILGLDAERFDIVDNHCVWLDRNDTIYSPQGSHAGRFSRGSTSWDGLEQIRRSSRICGTSLWMATATYYGNPSATMSGGTILRLWDLDGDEQALSSSQDIHEKREDYPEYCHYISLSPDQTRIVALMFGKIMIWSSQFEVKSMKFNIEALSDIEFHVVHLDQDLLLVVINNWDMPLIHVFDLVQARSIFSSDLNVLPGNISKEYRSYRLKLVSCPGTRTAAWMVELHHRSGNLALKQYLIYTLRVLQSHGVLSPNDVELKCSDPKPNSDYKSNIALSSKGKIALAGFGLSISIMNQDLAEEPSLIIPNREMDIVNSLAFDADGGLLAISCYKTVYIWNITNLTMVRQIKTSTTAYDLFYDLKLKCFRDTVEMIEVPAENQEVFLNDDWILLGAKKVVKIPADFRSSKRLIWGDGVFFAHQGGGATYIKIDVEYWKRCGGSLEG